MGDDESTIAGRRRDVSVWSIYPKGIIFPWYSTSPSLPPELAGAWKLCDGSDPDAPNLTNLFLRGDSKPATLKKEQDFAGKDNHFHKVHPTGDQQIPGWEYKSSPTDCGNSDEQPNVPAHMKVRFIIKT